MILNDQGSESQVIAYLNAAGITNITDCCAYYDWDGISPSATDYDVIIYLDGYSWGSGLQPAAYDALINFVKRGGTLITTEWLTYEWYGTVSDPFLDILPFLNANRDYDYGIDRSVVAVDHPLTTNLPAFMQDQTGFGYSHISPHPNAFVAVETADGYPALFYRDIGAGKTIHINHDMTYSDSIDVATGQMLVNAVLFHGYPANDAPIAPVIGQDATCNIIDVIPGPQYSCDTLSGTYLQEIWVKYTMNDLETNFEIMIDGYGPLIRRHANKCSPQNITLEMPADGYDHSISISTEGFSGCSFNAADLFQALPCGNPGTITDFELHHNSPTICYPDGTHQLKIKVYGVNLPATSDDAQVLIGGQSFPIINYEQKANGFVNMLVGDITANGTLDVSVQVVSGSSWTEYGLYTSPDCEQ